MANEAVSEVVAIANETRPSPVARGRELPVRDVRDLALAVVEGAVAAESLAEELKRDEPDRSRHFQDIAERLRAVVGRSSIRTALTDASGEGVPIALTPSPSRATSGLSRVAPLARTIGTEPADSGEMPLERRLERIEAMLRAFAESATLERSDQRLARLEDSVDRALVRREEGERYVLRSPEEALALAARLAERLRRDTRVVVRIEP